MKRKDTYNTKQKEIIINLIKNKTTEFTINDIYNELNRKVGLTTIYRLVDKLVDDNIVNKYISKNNKTYYQYLEKCNQENHFYLKCNNCGFLIHIDCDCINNLSKHINTTHKFVPDNENIIIKGLCKNCNKEKVITC